MNAKTRIGIIIFPFFCLLFSFYLLRTDPVFTYLLLDKPAIEPTKQLLQHFNGKADIPSLFNAEEKSHLIDVRRVIHYAYYLLELFTVLLVYCMLDDWKKVIRNGTLLLLAILLLAVLVPFDAFFTHFHEIVFPQGNWMFPPDSTLITFYPIKFFSTYGLAIVLHSLLTATFLLFVSRKG